jgi:hypothetical protein
MHTPQSTHMYCFVHRRFTAAQCNTAWVQPGRSGHDIVVQHARLNPRTYALLCPLQIHAAQCSTVLVQPGAYGYDACCFSIRLNPLLYAFAFVHCRSPQLSAAQSWCSLGVSGYDAHCFQHARLQSAHALLCPLQIHCSSGSTVLGSLGVSGYDARCFGIHRLHRTHALLSPRRLAAAQCSKSWCCLEHWGILTLVVSSVHPIPIHAHALLSPLWILQLCSTVLVQPGA